MKTENSKSSSASGNDVTYAEAMACSGRKELKIRLIKDALLGVVALCCIIVFVNWPQQWIIVLGAIFILSISWLSEMRPRSTERLSAARRAVVITGCDTGFGHLLAQHLDGLGATVFAGCLYADGPGALKLKAEGSHRLHVLQMDVTCDSQIAKCVEYINKTVNGSGLWGLVNNAAISMVGEIELTTMSQFSRLVDVNQLGMVRVTKALLPAIRQRKGRVVNVSSVRGCIAEPYTAAYAMNKFAVEAFSDILRLEMKKFQVSVSIIEPGNFGAATEGMNMDRIRGEFELMWSTLDTAQKADYGRAHIDNHINFIDSSRQFSCFNVAPVIDAMSQALFALKPRTRYLIPGGSGSYDPYRWKVLVQPYLPTWLMDYLLTRGYSGIPNPAVLSSERSVK